MTRIDPTSEGAADPLLEFPSEVPQQPVAADPAIELPAAPVGMMNKGTAALSPSVANVVASSEASAEDAVLKSPMPPRQVASALPLAARVPQPPGDADRWRLVAARAADAVSAHRQTIWISLTLVGSAALGSATTFIVMSRTPSEVTSAVNSTTIPSAELPQEPPVTVRPSPPPVSASPSANPGALTRVAPADVAPSEPDPRPAPPAAPPPAAPPPIERVAAPTLSIASPLNRSAATASSRQSPVTAANAPAPAQAERRSSPLPAFRGALIVTSSPAGAQVYVNGAMSGVTPLRLEDVRAGSVAVRVELEGYQRWSTALRIIANQRTTAVAELRALPVP